MDQKQTKKNNDCGNKKDKGKKKEETSSSPTSTTVVLKVDMHCNGRSRIIKWLCGFQDLTEALKLNLIVEGMESSKTGKLSTTGDVDPTKPMDKLTPKINNNIQLISPLSKKSHHKKTKEIPVTTVVLKLPLLCPCQGCDDKIRKMVMRTKGVDDVGVDREKGMVTVKGTMDVKALVEKLSDKYKRKVEVVPPRKEKKENEVDKCGNNNDIAQKKKKSSGDNIDDGKGSKSNNKCNNDGDGERKTENVIDYTVSPAYGYCYHGCVNGNYMGQYYPVSQMFNDENPYACCMM